MTFWEHGIRQYTMKTSIYNSVGINIPILIIAFNRPDTSKQTLEYLRKSKPKYLYVAIDGARANKDGETELVQKVKEVYEKIDWECNVYSKYNTQNKGAEVTVSEAVTWVLSENDTVIVLEDDVVAPPSFLRFAQEMLDKYKDNKNVYQICGAQFTPMNASKYDYHFSYLGHTGCGWATFKRAWNNFSLNVSGFDEYIDDNGLCDQFSSTKIVRYFLQFVKRLRADGVGNNSWDKCWEYIRIKNKGLSIVPRVNLTRNIGYFGLHGNGEKEFQKLDMHEDFIVMKHPSTIEVDKEYDRFHYDKYLHVSFLRKVYNKLRYEINKMLVSN